MKFTKLILFSAALLLTASTFAQKMKVISGNLADLKGVDKIKIVFDYSDLAVGDFKNENDYIAKKMADAEKDKPGTGETWKSKWFSDRPERYEPKFMELFSKYTESIKSGKDVESDVVMNVHCTFIEPGYNIGISRKPAAIDFTVRYKKGETEIAVVTIAKAPGSGAMGYDFDAGFRISEGFAKAGKELGALVGKAIKK
jgi:hypothetical protein